MTEHAGGRDIALRLLSEDDRDELIARARASRRLHGDWVQAPQDDEAFDAALRRATTDTVESVLACRLDDGAITAVFNFSQIFRGGFQNAYLGFYAFVPFAGHGWATAGMHAALDHAFGPLALHRVEVNVQPDNHRSRALVERVGFRHEGFSPRYLHIAGAWRDHERYAMTVEDRHGVT